MMKVTRAFCALLLLACSAILALASTPPALDSSSFDGANWADARDNFIDGWIIPSGLDHHATEAEVAEQARQLARQLQEKLGINTVRLGINPATVLDPIWWPKYRAAITACRQLNLQVILACWEADSSRDGRIDDPDTFQRMWDRVLADFSQDAAVFFEIFNEPHGYTDAEWRNLAADWLQRHLPQIAHQDRSRVLVGGSGYCEHLTAIATDQRLAGCRLSFHLYAWFGHHETAAAWHAELAKRIGQANAHRTVVTEWGAPQRDLPPDYYTQPSTDDDANRAYLQAMSDQIRAWNMGSIYWPGLRDGDPFSLTQRTPSGALKITNESGRDRVRWSFNQP